MRTSFTSTLVALLLSTSLIAQNPLAIPDTVVGPVINLTMAPSTVSYYSTPTETMGFNGDILGPTLMLTKNDSVTIHVTNDLPEVTTVHWHGMHVSPENDGGPHSLIPPGTTWTKTIKVMDKAATYWYHPHLHAHTNEHVIKGLAGFIITRDAEEAALDLPRTYGVDDIPIVVQSRDFDSNDQFVVGSALDTDILVNGTLDPFVELPEQVVRLRLLNGSSERSYIFGFSDNRSFNMIASDGGLLEASLSLNRLRLSPGERAEILVDLQGDLGQTIQLMSYGSELPNAIYGAGQPGMGPGQTIPGYTSNPLNGNDFNILQINVVAQTSGAVTTIPSSLVTLSPWQESNSDQTRSLTFTPQNMGPTAIQGPFFINGTTFDMNVINQTIPLGNIEVWELTNQSPIAHPFHIHDVQFFVLDKNGSPPPAYEAGRKDVILVQAMSTVRFITRFEDFASDTMPYMYHCHMLTHEDQGMMQQFLVVDTATIGIEDHLANGNNVQVFPNPVIDELQIRIKSNGKVLVDLYDLQGRIIRNENVSDRNGLITINVSDLLPGIYLLEVKNGSERSTFRVVKQ